MTVPKFITLGPTGTCHEHALRRYLEFQGLPDARVELVGDFIDRARSSVRELPNGFLVQCSSHPEVHIVTERYRQEVFVIDTFVFPAKEMGLLVRRDRPRTSSSLGVVADGDGLSGPRTVGDNRICRSRPTRSSRASCWRVSTTPGSPSSPSARSTPTSFGLRERYGEVDTTWVVYGQPPPLRGAADRKPHPTVPQRRAGAGMSYGVARSPGEPAPPLAPGRPPEDGVVDRERYPRMIGEGYALGCIDDLEEGYGFRKVRGGLGVSASRERAHESGGLLDEVAPPRAPAGLSSSTGDESKWSSATADRTFLAWVLCARGRSDRWQIRCSALETPCTCARVAATATSAARPGAGVGHQLRGSGARGQAYPDLRRPTVSAGRSLAGSRGRRSRRPVDGARR